MRFSRAFAIGSGLGIAILGSAAACGADWPQFRGPAGGAVSMETNLPSRWSQTENVRWKAPLPGRGVSSPVSAGGRVYITACTGYQQRRLHVLCFDAKDGRQVWERQFTATGNTFCHPTTCMAGPTPVTDGERVYALFACGDLACLDREGDLLWYRSLVGDYPLITNQVGMASSPVLWKGLLFVAMENAGESFAAALDKVTGQNRWKIERQRTINWVTPKIFTNGERTEVLFQTERDMTAYDPGTGQKLWAYTASGTSPVVAPMIEKDLVLVSGGDYVAIKPGNDGIEPKIVWKTNRLRTTYSSPVVYQGLIYAVNQAGVLNCADAADGAILYQERLPKGPYWASPVAADGKIYVLSEDGTTTVLQAGRQPKVLSTNSLNDRMLATPAIANGAIYLRSDQHLYCILHSGG